MTGEEGGSAFWRLLPDVRRGERARFLFFLALFALLTAAETVGLAGADALFLAGVGIEQLPLALVLASLTAVVGSLGYAAAVGSARNDALFVVLLLLATGALGVAGAGVALEVPAAFFALLCLFYVNRAVFLNHYWTFAGDHFDALSSKRLFALFAIGSSLGGAVGGAAAAGVSWLVGPEWLIAGWMALLVASAALVASQRVRLRRWIPLEVMEADDTSVEGMRGADRYLRRSPLGRWLVVSAASMVVALYVAQYVYLAVFAREFQDASRLALFFGIYLAVANVAEIGVEVAVSRWLIPRFGVPTANLIHPFVTIASFLGLAASQSLPVAVAARANRELLENALANPVRNLTYNALPHRYRGRVRAFLEGIVLNGGMAAAGVVLVLVAPGISLASVCVLGVVASVLYLLANLRVRREYLRTLISEIGTGHLDLREVEGEIGRSEVELLVGFWRSLLADAAQPPLRLVDRMARVLARHELAEPLLDALSHPRPRVRLAALEALAAMSVPGLDEALTAALADPEPALRRAALEVLAREPKLVGEAALAGCLDSPDPLVRARAAVLLGPAGREILEAMLAGDAPVATAACLRALPARDLARVAGRMLDPDPEVRAAALERLAEAGGGAEVAPEALVPSLHHADPRVRAAAVRLTATLPSSGMAELLGERLGDPAREVRRLAVEALERRPEPGFAQAAPRLRSDRAVEVEAAARVLSQVPGDEALQALRSAFRRRARDAWRALFAMRLVPEEGPLALRFLRLAFADAFARNARTAFLLLEHLEPAAAIRALEKALRFASSRERADALEVLSHLGDREGARLLVALFESAPLEERSVWAASVVGPPADLAEAMRQAPQFGRFTRTAAAALDTSAPPGASEGSMERLLLLRTVPLFSQMSLEQLEAIDELMREVHYLEGEIICREGDAGDELFVLLDGEVRFYQGGGATAPVHLSTMSAGSYFGEMAVLTDDRRSATAVVSRPARLLSLRGDQLKELLLDMPEISFEVFRALTQRVRSAERRARVAEDHLSRQPGAAGTQAG